MKITYRTINVPIDLANDIKSLADGMSKKLGVSISQAQIIAMAVQLYKEAETKGR